MIGWRSKPSTTEEDKPKGFDDFELRLGDLMRGERATLGKSLLDVQRELKIKATYIAAIENADISAFETPGFVAGYVRSYARYLGMDPEWAFARFCNEANYTVSHGLSAAAAAPRPARLRREYAEPLANPHASFIPRAEALWQRVEPAAVGSVAVLVALVLALGYGGWSVLQEVQRVQIAPVDEAPTVMAEIDPLMPADGAATPADAVSDREELAALDRLYRPEALDVPVLTPRDGPISAIDPGATGVLAATDPLDAVDLALEAALDGEVQVIADAAAGVEILAVRPAWVQVDAADGTVLFEKILEPGESYTVEAMETAAVFRTGNSGAIYFVVGGQAYGPAAPGASVVKNIALSPETVVQNFALADCSQDDGLRQVASLETDLDAVPLCP
mgnify:CR=1 FL=1